MPRFQEHNKFNAYNTYNVRRGVRKGWPKPVHGRTVSTLKPQRTINSFIYFEKISKSFWWNTGYVENPSGRFGIKGWFNTCVFAPLSSTKGTQGNFQKGIWKTSKIRCYRRGKWIRMGSTFFFPTKTKNESCEIPKWLSELKQAI